MRRCKNKCGNELPTVARCETIFQRKGYCDIDCLAEHTRTKNVAKDAKEKAANEAWKASIPTKPSERKAFVKRTVTFKSEAQVAFNAFIRARDHKENCISCDRSIADIEGRDGWKPGGCWDAGHYLDVGSNESLRFDEANVHRQCKSDNAGAGKYSKKKRSVDDRYRQKLIERIGIDEVTRLEGPHEPKRYRKEDYLEIKQLYKNKLKELL
jgi:hypothetical protein